MLNQLNSVLVVAALLWSSNLHAQSRGTVVLVASEDTSQQSLEMIAAIEGQLSDLPVTLDTVWISRALGTWATDTKELDLLLDGKEPLVLVWWDPESPAEFFVSVQSKIGRAVIRREISASQRVAGFESMGLVVHELVDALLNEPAPVEPEAEIEPTETDESDKTEKPSEPIQEVTEKATEKALGEMNWGPSVAYSLRTFSDKISLFHGVNIGFETAFKNGLRAGLGYVYNFPQVAQFDDFDLEVSSYEFLLRAAYDRPLGKFRLGAGLAFAVDFVNQTTIGTSANSDTSLRSNMTPVFSFIPTLYAGFKPKNPVYIFIDAGLFIGLREIDYFAKHSEQNEIVDSSHRMGPSIKVGTSLFF